MIKVWEQVSALVQTADEAFVYLSSLNDFWGTVKEPDDTTDSPVTSGSVAGSPTVGTSELEKCHCDLLFSAISATQTVTENLKESDIEGCPISGLSTSNNDLHSKSAFSASRDGFQGSCQMTAVLVENSESCENPCVETCFDGETNNAPASDTGTKELFASIELAPGCELLPNETITVTMPCKATNGEEVSVVFLDEDSGEYSTEGISSVSACNNGSITFTTNHLTVFATAKKIKLGLRQNAIAHLFVSSIALCCFLAMAVWIAMDLMKQKKEKRAVIGKKKRKIPILIKQLILFVSFFNIVHEVVLIVYYALPPERTQKGSPMNSVFAFFIILPSVFHLWAFSVALFSWTEIYLKSTMIRSQLDVAACKRTMFWFNGIVSAVIFGSAVSIAVIDDEKWLNRIAKPLGAFMGIMVLASGLSIFIATRGLVFHIQDVRDKVGLPYNPVLEHKLTVTGRLIGLCFTSYSVATFFSVMFNDIYLEHDAMLNAVIKLSDLIGFLMILYVYTPSIRKKREPNWVDGTAVGVTKYKQSTFKMPIGARTGSKNKGRSHQTASMQNRNSSQRDEASETEEKISIVISKL